MGSRRICQPISRIKRNGLGHISKTSTNGWGHPSPEIMDKFVKEVLLDLLGLNEDS